MDLTADDFANVTGLALRPSWHRRAACRGKGTDWWFPSHGGINDAARAVCEACPVRRECLSFALEAPEALAGIWAGTSERERRRMRRPIGSSGSSRPHLHPSARISGP